MMKIVKDIVLFTTLFGSSVTPIVNNNVTSRPILMPPGCTCINKENVVIDSDCEHFDCFCTCDLTVGSCDMNCCCDKDCNNNELESFHNECKNKYSSVAPLPKMCYETMKTIEQAESYYPSRLGDSIEDSLQRVLCVRHENSAVKGNYFLTRELTSTAASTSTNILESVFSKINSIKANSWRDNIPDGKYDVGDFIPSFRQEQTTQSSSVDPKVEMYSSYFTLPTPSDAGLCDDFNAVMFSKDSDNSCWRLIQDLASQCEADLSVDQYVYNYFIGRTDDATISLYSDATSGEDKRLPIELKIMKPSDIIIDGTKVTNWNETDKICHNTLKKISYVIEITSAMISRVVATADLVNVHLGTSTIKQEFQVTFVQIPPLSDSEPRVLSGNPGYLFGAPVLAGTFTNGNNFEYANRGFQIMGMSPNGESCDMGTKLLTVGFGENVQVGCSVELTRAKLKDLCTSSNHSFFGAMSDIDSNSIQDILIPKWFLNKYNRVGIFGNADPKDNSHWLPFSSILQDETQQNIKSRMWFPKENKCDGLITKVHYKFLWTYTGNTDNPQAKIIRAEKEYDTEKVLIHLVPPGQSQKYQFTTTVSWVFVKPQSQVSKLPHAQLLFSVPEDVFYPFQSSTATHRAFSPLQSTKVLISLLIALIVTW